MSANKASRQMAKFTGFASGVSFVFGLAHAAGGETGTALLAFIAAILLYGTDIEFNERKDDE